MRRVAYYSIPTFQPNFAERETLASTHPVLLIGVKSAIYDCLVIIDFY